MTGWESVSGEQRRREHRRQNCIFRGNEARNAGPIFSGHLLSSLLQRGAATSSHRPCGALYYVAARLRLAFARGLPLLLRPWMRYALGELDCKNNELYIAFAPKILKNFNSDCLRCHSNVPRRSKRGSMVKGLSELILFNGSQ